MGAFRRPELLAAALLGALVVVLKLPTLRTPAYWDEMAWLTQAKWLSAEHLWKALPGLRPDAAFWGHPPGLHLTGAVTFQVFGASVGLAHLVILGFAVIGVVSTFFLARLFYDTTTGCVAALFLLLCPLYLAQAGMFLADVPVTALGVTCVYLALTRRYVAYLVCASYMVVLKETAVAIVVALVLYLFLSAGERTKERLIDALKYAAPLVVIGAFALWQRITTGHFFAIYDFEFQLFDPTFDAMRRQFHLITEWIFLNQYRWVLTVLIGADLIWFGARERKDAWLLGLVVLFSGYSFVGLYFLPRYLLPVFPFFFMLGAHSLLRLLRAPQLRIAVAIVAVAAAAWVLTVQPFTGNSEMNLRYLDTVNADQAMARYVAAQHPGATVLTDWPRTVEFGSPLLGYVERPISTKGLANTRNIDDADLIVVSSVGAKHKELTALAENRDWPVAHTVRKGDVEVVLYARPGAR